ncbi:MAG: glycosyltransferase [Bacteroidota bacterium]
MGRLKTSICFAVTNDLNFDQRMIRICGSLSAAGHEVSLVGRCKSQSAALHPQSFGQERLSCWFEKGKLFYLEFNIRLFLYLLFQKASILGAVDLDTLWAVSLAARIKGSKLVYDAHEYFSEVPEVVDRPRVQAFWEWTARQLIPRVDLAYTVCGSLADLFAKKYGMPFELVRNVPLLRPPSEQSPAQPPVLLYQGALNQARGLEVAIQAMQQIEGVELWLAGEGDLSEELRRLVRQLDLERRVRFLGHVLPEDLHQLTPQATIGLNLLENKGLNYYYSLANKTFDYIMAGRPAIHMDFPEYRLLNEEFEIALLLPELAVDPLCQAIRQLLEDPILYERLAQNCRQARRVLNWTVEEQRLLDCYRKINPA